MTIDEVIKEMYDVVSFEPGQRPDWRREEAIFAPGARVVRVNDSGVFEFDMNAFARNFDAMIDSGELPSFWEGEIWRRTDLFGDMAHVLSAYESRRSRDGEYINRGVNSIQLFQRDGSWWISAMIWRRDGAEVCIPADAPPAQ